MPFASTNWHRNSHTKWSNQRQILYGTLIYGILKMIQIRTFLVVQWLRFHAPNTGGGDVGLISDWGSKTPCAMQHSQKKGKKSTNEHTKRNRFTDFKMNLRLSKRKDGPCVCLVSHSHSVMSNSDCQAPLPTQFTGQEYWSG